MSTILEFKEKLKSLALLNAIIEPEWEYRYYSYNSKWGEKEEMASLRDSCGGEWFILFFDNKVAFKCTSPIDGLSESFEELKNNVPADYATFLNEPAFSMDSGSCIWHLENDNWIKLGNEIFDLPTPEVIQKMGAKEIRDFVEEFYEQEISIDIIESLFNVGFSEELAKTINPEIDIDGIREELSEIGINS